jgi:release factor glutamine methyltransferase
MTVAELQREFLASDGQKIAPEDFFILLAHAAHKEKTFLLAHPEYTLDKTGLALVRDFFKRRLRCEPVAFIVGHKEFFGYDFRVTKDTLIPRPETELLVDLALDRILNFESGISAQKGKPATFVDIGTGSGNIVISLVKTLLIKFKIQDSRFNFFATDISEKALMVAEKNAKAHDVDQVIAFLRGDLLAPYTKEYLRPDTSLIIVANLPYLSEAIYRDSDDAVRKFEPRSALVSERGGLDHYYRLLEEVKDIRAKLPSITIFLEISPEQADVLKKHILSIFPTAHVTTHKDLAGKDRTVEICL